MFLYGWREGGGGDYLTQQATEGGVALVDVNLCNLIVLMNIWVNIYTTPLRYLLCEQYWQSVVADDC